MSNEGGGPRSRGIRVAVRVRPITEVDASAECSMLTVSTEKKEILLQKEADTKKARRFVYDAVFTVESSQEEVYRLAGVQELVDSAVAGYHSTVFAYGQTGSGKTFTMEGIKYQTTAPNANSKYNRGGAAGSTITADLSGTPEHQLGVIPRAVQALFAAINRESTQRRFSVRCSFVQIYKEQVYDLLNPTSLAPGVQGESPGGKQKESGFGGKRAAGQPPPGFSGALRMRWSKTEDFYLENLFKCECQSAEELMTMFGSGVQNKIMASHRLNAASSRSHCLFTIYIDSSPMASPNEVLSSRLTLVDLAGSERGSATGATEGKIRDESVAINKSLFTLRHVITTLTASAGEDKGGGEKGTAHIPYRDSKLTSLLKNSLGGNSLTTMIACLAPLDAHYEENLSTLEYASRANRITNQVALNEDPKSKTIRELRAEVAFLRSQLAAIKNAQPGLIEMLNLTELPPGGDQADATAAGGGGDGVGGTPEMKLRLITGANQDMDKLATKLLDAISLVQQLSGVNQALRTGYDAVGQHSEQLRIDNDSLMIENAQLRDKLSFYDGAIVDPHMQSFSVQSFGPMGASFGSPGSNNSGSPGGNPVDPPQMFANPAAAFAELQHERKENTILHEKIGDAALASTLNGHTPSQGGANRPASQGRTGSRSGRRISLPALPHPVTLNVPGVHHSGPGSPMIQGPPRSSAQQLQQQHLQGPAGPHGPFSPKGPPQHQANNRPQQQPLQHPQQQQQQQPPPGYPQQGPQQPPNRQNSGPEISGGAAGQHAGGQPGQQLQKFQARLFRGLPVAALRLDRGNALAQLHPLRRSRPKV